MEGRESYRSQANVLGLQQSHGRKSERHLPLTERPQRGVLASSKALASKPSNFCLASPLPALLAAVSEWM